MKRQNIPLESVVEAKFLKELKKYSQYKLKVRKMNGIGYRSWPDRMVLGPRRFILFIELKRPKLGKLSPGQIDLFNEMAELSHFVPVFTDGKIAAKFVIEKLQEYLAQIAK